MFLLSCARTQEKKGALDGDIQAVCGTFLALAALSHKHAAKKSEWCADSDLLRPALCSMVLSACRSIIADKARTALLKRLNKHVEVTGESYCANISSLPSAP